ncbi:MAG: 50S ribosomal protein L4 [Candidatus Kerfeldbacteria bacterium]|nr:50S ribosomal protein L4 [Candidatus Kerfeldbacteria bacterium]
MTKLQNIKVMNLKGEAVRELDLPPAVTSLQVKPEVVHQVVVGLRASRRAGTAHTKDRSEVAGGGKKPWKQKGTGRARHGSIRSPLWIGGGAVFGPRNTRNYGHRLPAKLRAQARAMVVADYLSGGQVAVIDSLPLEHKTKLYAELLRQLKMTKGKCLVLLTAKEVDHRRGFQNLPNVTVAPLSGLNALDGLSAARWLVTEDGWRELLAFVKS